MPNSRRTTVFIDGSARRDTLRKMCCDTLRRLEESVDNHEFGQFPCAAEEQLVRVNYHTDEPVEITETVDDTFGGPKPMVGRIELGDHEAYSAQRILEGYRRLVRHIEGWPPGDEVRDLSRSTATTWHDEPPGWGGGMAGCGEPV